MNQQTENQIKWEFQMELWHTSYLNSIKKGEKIRVAVAETMIEQLEQGERLT